MFHEDLSFLFLNISARLSFMYFNDILDKAHWGMQPKIKACEKRNTRLGEYITEGFQLHVSFQSSVIYYSTHPRKNVIYLFYTISKGLLKNFGAWKKENKSADVIWRGFEAICVCVCFHRSRSTTNENAQRSHVIV